MKQKYISYTSWENNNVLELSLIYIETPYVEDEKGLGEKKVSTAMKSDYI